MRTGVAFSTIITEVQRTARMSTNSSHSTYNLDYVKLIINREYRWCAQKWAWPFRKIESDVTLVASTQTYTFPTDIRPAGISEVWAQIGDVWYPVQHGIGRFQRSLYDNTETSWPPQRVQFVDDEDGTYSIEVWPIPDQAGTIRLVGQADLPDLSADADKCLIDADVLVLRAASQILAYKDRADAAYLANQAAERANAILRNTSNLGPDINHGGRNGKRILEPYLDYYPPEA